MTGEGSTSKSTSDPIVKRTRAGTNNPEGSVASPAVGEKSSQPPQGGSYEEGEEYNLRWTPGGSAATPLRMSEKYLTLFPLFFYLVKDLIHLSVIPGSAPDFRIWIQTSRAEFGDSLF